MKLLGVQQGFTLLTVADFNRDGNPDLLVQLRDQPFLAWYERCESGTFTVQHSTRVPASATDVSGTDIDGNGGADIVFVMGLTVSWSANVDGDFLSAPRRSAAWAASPTTRCACRSWIWRATAI